MAVSRALPGRGSPRSSLKPGVRDRFNVVGMPKNVPTGRLDAATLLPQCGAQSPRAPDLPIPLPAWRAARRAVLRRPHSARANARPWPISSRCHYRLSKVLRPWLGLTAGAHASIPAWPPPSARSRHPSFAPRPDGAILAPPSTPRKRRPMTSQDRRRRIDLGHHAAARRGPGAEARGGVQGPHGDRLHRLLARRQLRLLRQARRQAHGPAPAGPARPSCRARCRAPAASRPPTGSIPSPPRTAPRSASSPRPWRSRS